MRCLGAYGTREQSRAQSSVISAGPVLRGMIGIILLRGIRAAALHVLTGLALRGIAVSLRRM